MYVVSCYCYCHRHLLVTACVHAADVEQWLNLQNFLLLSATMDSLTVNDVTPACEASQPHQYADYGYNSGDSLSYASASSTATLQHSTPLTHSSCAEAAAASNVTHSESALVEDCAHKVASTSYSVSSSSRQSPLPHQSGVVVSAAGTVLPPPPRSSDVQRQMSQCSSYHSRCPVFPPASTSSSSLCRETTKASPLEPPKKPLTPYMRFSKSVRLLWCN